MIRFFTYLLSALLPMAVISYLASDFKKPSISHYIPELIKKIKSHPKKSTPPSLSAPTVIQESPLRWDWKSINTDDLYFPEDFMWGVATSAHQAEGNCTTNDWARWEKNNPIAPTALACDHWNRYKEDIQLIKALGVKAYRFSIEWSKIEPEEGIFDEKALAHYRDVCKELVKNNIKPLINLNHYTLPQWFADRGGFENKENIAFFVRYSEKVFDILHPYAYLWITFNSPTSYAARAYHKKLAPPGIEDMQLMQEVLKNILEAHVQVYQHLKQRVGGPESKIGILHNIYQVEPAGTFDSIPASFAYDLFNKNVYTFFTEGTFNAHIPFKVSVKHINKKAPQSLDFIGLNYYSHCQLKNYTTYTYQDEIPTLNDMYTLYAEGLYSAISNIAKNLASPLNIPIYVTENGIATDNESNRELFFKQYLFALSQAIKDGYDVRGYVVWSLMDNYEWGSYDKPYGIYKVDFKTQERTRKGREGAYYFTDVVKRFS